MTPPLSRLSLAAHKKKNVEGACPIAAPTSRRLYMGSEKIHGQGAANTLNAAPNPSFSLGSIWIEQSSTPSKNKGNKAPRGDDVQTPSTRVPPKTPINMAAKAEKITPSSRRMTRSIIMLSESKERTVLNSEVRRPHNTAEADLKKPISEKAGKRVMETIVIESSSKKKKSSETQKSQVESTFYIPPENRFGASLNVFFRQKVISKLNSKLTARQKEMFRQTCFGHFLHMNDLRLQHQVIHKMLLMEVRQSTYDEMWFKVGGKHLKFSKEEFALVTGLKCHGDDNTSMYNVGHCRIKHSHFRHQKNVYRKDIENTFNNLTTETTDEDTVKLGILYLISSYLYTSTSANVVADEVINLVDSPHMDTFPWGKDLFQITYKYLKLALAKPNPKFEDPKGLMSYRLHGFPLAFQIWVYESITSMDGKICSRVDHSYPRIINWSNDDSRVSSTSIDKILINHPAVEVAMIYPSDVEKMTHYFQGLLERERIAFPSSIAAGANLMNDPIHQAKDHNYASSSNPSFMPCSHNINHDQPRIAEPPIIGVLEDIRNQMLEMQATQAQLLDSQPEIKANIKSLETTVDSTFETLLRMFAGAKKHVRQGQDTTDSIANPSNEPYTTYKKNIANHGNSIFQTTDISGRRIVIQSAEVQTDVTQYGRNPSLFRRENDGKSGIVQSEAIDEINFTEEDLIRVDEIVKSANSTKSKSAQRIGSGVMPEKSSSAKAATPGSPGGTAFHLYAFKEDMTPPDEDDIAAFEEWFAEGYRPHHKKYKFLPSKDVINPPFQFGQQFVDTKTWWHELSRHNVYLRDSHLDVCFYYLRKMIRFSPVINYKGTTTDPFFGSIIRSAYKACKDDMSKIENFTTLLQYASGDYMHCNTSWSDVDHVLIPIMMEHKAHWLLGDFGIKDRTLHLYNSSRLTVRDRMVTADVESFAYVLPCLMAKINAWPHTLVDSGDEVEPLSVKLVTDIPQDEYGHNCGLYVMKYAEYLIQNKFDVMPKQFDASKSRIHIAAQLLKHGCDKMIEEYETDYDLVPRSVRRDKKMKGVVIE